MFFAQAAPLDPAAAPSDPAMPLRLIILPILMLLLLVVGLFAVRYRWYRTVGLVLGILLGGLGGALAAGFASGTNDLKALCIEIGSGLGAVTGAILGGTSSILDAISQGKRSD
jgi:hypothetical protein